jgi:hypothetical protein
MRTRRSRRHTSVTPHDRDGDRKGRSNAEGIQNASRGAKTLRTCQQIEEVREGHVASSWWLVGGGGAGTRRRRRPWGAGPVGRRPRCSAGRALSLQYRHVRGVAGISPGPGANGTEAPRWAWADVGFPGCPGGLAPGGEALLVRPGRRHLPGRAGGLLRHEREVRSNVIRRDLPGSGGHRFDVFVPGGEAERSGRQSTAWSLARSLVPTVRHGH